METKSLECAAWKWAMAHRCNRSEPWSTYKHCQRSCYFAGSGYEGDRCCPDPPASPSLPLPPPRVSESALAQRVEAAPDDLVDLADASKSALAQGVASGGDVQPMPPVALAPPSPPHVNEVEEDPNVGVWGGTCTCPDGEQYEVGDNGDFCGSLATHAIDALPALIELAVSGLVLFEGAFGRLLLELFDLITPLSEQPGAALEHACLLCTARGGASVVRRIRCV